MDADDSQDTQKLRFIITASDGRWCARFVSDSGDVVEKSFTTRNRAQAWVSRCEAARRRYVPEGPDAPSIFNTTLGDIVRRYGREVTPQKRGARTEAYRVNKIAEASIGGILLADLTSKAVADYRNMRLLTVAGQTARIELYIIKKALDCAQREWGFELPRNPVGLISLPSPGKPRERRLEPGELEKLEAHLAGHPVALAVVRFAVHTAMRRGEMLGMRWRHVNMGQRMVYLPQTKNGHARTVPLPDGAFKVLEDLAVTGGAVFPIDESALRWAWNDACRRTRIADLRFHDLRHEGVSRLFEMGLSAPEVALISGHRTIAMLMRYLHLRPIELARKLKGLKAPPQDGHGALA